MMNVIKRICIWKIKELYNITRVIEQAKKTIPNLVLAMAKLLVCQCLILYFKIKVELSQPWGRLETIHVVRHGVLEIQESTFASH